MTVRDDGRRGSGGAVISHHDSASVDDGDVVQVVVNNEGQYSVWSAGSEPPSGWHCDGFVGDRRTALDHIAEVWTNLLPRSARAGPDRGA